VFGGRRLYCSPWWSFIAAEPRPTTILLFTRRIIIITNVEDKLNEFSSHFDRQNTAPVSVSFPVADSQLLQLFTVEEAEARKQDSRKADGPDGTDGNNGPDGVSTATLKHCL